MIENLINKTNKVLAKFRKAVSEDSSGLQIDDKYSNFIIYLMNELQNYLVTLENYQKLGFSTDIYGLNTTFFARMKSYIERKEFKPLLTSPEFNGLFDGSKKINTPDMLINYIDANMAKILKFSVLSNQVLKSNKIFDDEIIFGYGRSCKVASKLDNISKEALSANALVSTYANGGFDKLCPKELEDKRRCDEAMDKAIKNKQSKKTRHLGGWFYGLF